MVWALHGGLRGPTVISTWHDPDTDTDNVAMSALDIAMGARTLAPNETTKASISAYGHVTIVDDSIASYGEGEISVDDSGAFKLKTERSTFVPPAE